MIRANKRRPTKNGATSIFTGLLECADCGTKLSLRSSKSYLYKLSDGYEAEQEQLKHEIETLKAEVSEADTEATNVSRLIAVTKKYTRIDKLTPEILNTFVDKIVVHECGKKDGNTENVPNVKPPKCRRGRRKSMPPAVLISLSNAITYPKPFLTNCAAL